MNLKIAIVLILLLSLSGCGGKQYQWMNDNHDDTSRFRRESAECKLMAENAARGVREQGNTSYTATTTYEYGGYSTTNVQPDPFNEFANNLSTAFARDSAREKTYELCMQSKGYYQVEKPITQDTTTSERTNKVALGGACAEHKDCAGKAMCGLANTCISFKDWQAEAYLRLIERNKVALGGVCVEHKDCAGKAMCGLTNTCISLRDWQAEAHQRWIKRNKKIGSSGK